MYVYRAKVVKVVDGDTMDVLVDLGFDVSREERVRVYNLNTFETRLGRGTTPAMKAKGLEAKDLATELLLGKDVIIKTHKDQKGKYGRYLAEIEMDGGVDYTEFMRDAGFHDPKPYAP